MSNSFSQIIESSEIIQIKQVRELAELFGFETRNKYSIKDHNSEEFCFCAEQSLGFGGLVLLQFLGHWRTFDLIGSDRNNSQVFRARHPFRWFFQRLDVYRHNRLIGSFQQRFSIFSKKFDILDPNGHRVMTMNSPFFMFWTFPIQKNGRDVAVIEKKWSGLLQEAFTDADNFRLRFSDRYLSIDEKVLLLAGTIFVDLIYFEIKAG